MNLGRQAGAEFVGTALLLAAVVGSGIVGERLAEGNAALALLANSLATGFALVALIVASAAQRRANPAVTLARGLTTTFSGTNPGHVAPFILASWWAQGSVLRSIDCSPRRQAPDPSETS